MPHNLNAQLQERGILQAAMDAGWEIDGNGWKYPICDLDGNVISHRWKNADSRGTPKYQWPTGKPRDHMEANYYIPPNVNLRQQIRDADGVLYIASGEPDVLAYYAAGIYNVLCWFGEGNIPASLADDLQIMGVQEIRYFLDRDDTGARSGQKVLGKLAGTGIGAHVYRLPEYLGAGGDINRLWMNVAFDAEAFQRTLEDIADDLDLMVILDSAPSVSQSRTWSGTLPTEFLRDLEFQLQLHGVERYNADGWSNAVRCLFDEHEHDHRRPAAHWKRNTHCFYCHKCGETWNAKDTAEKFNIRLADYYDDHAPAQMLPSVNPGDQQSPTPADTIAAFARENARRYGTVTENGAIKLTDDQVGDLILGYWNDDYLWFRETWHQYTDGVWQALDNAVIRRDVWDACSTFKYALKPNKNRVSSICDYLKAKGYVLHTLIDSSETYVNLRNGLYNLHTHQLEPHRRDLYFTTQATFAYNPEARCPLWMQCLDQWLPDSAFQRVLQEAMGYSLTRQTHYEKAFWLHGEAATGKTTVLRVLEALLGSNGTSLDWNALNDRSDRNQLANLEGKCAALCSEVRPGVRLDGAYMKQIVSGETMTVRPLYRQSCAVKMTAKLWWAMNDMPPIRERSEAIDRRLIIFPFEQQIPPAERDPRLFDKLQDEISGIFNWAMQGLIRLEEQKRFTETDRIQEMVQRYRASNDVERQFFDECLVMDPNGRIQAADLYDSYRAYCERCGEQVKSQREVARDWERLGLTKTRASRGFYYKGAILVSEISQ